MKTLEIKNRLDCAFYEFIENAIGEVGRECSPYVPDAYELKQKLNDMYKSYEKELLKIIKENSK